MNYTQLGRTGISVSRIALGTMTFGQQNSQDEAFLQLDHALDAGINFFDTAEMYPVPPSAETAGRTEAIIGAWLERRGCRDKVVLASKIAGPGLAHLERGTRAFERSAIEAALTDSLRRLKTDCIDLYQLHWPERKANFFGRLGYNHPDLEPFTPFEEVLDTLDRQIQAGRIRAVGLSNETPWGLMRCLALSEQAGLPRIASIQNPYNLLNRSFEVGLSEIALRESCGLLAYSPLAFGTLTGKYLDGAKPAGARLTLFPHYERYTKPQAAKACRAYVDLARSYDLDPAIMALAFVLAQPFVTSAIIGATSLEQLVVSIESNRLQLPPALMDAIEALHLSHPFPAP